MKALFSSFVLALSFLFSLMASGQTQKDVMARHLEVVGTLNTVAVHSESLAKEIKKWNDPIKVADGQRIYMKTRAEISGAIAKYKAVIYNPKLLKTDQNKEDFAGILNSVIKSQNDFVKFYDDNYKSFVTQPVSSFAVETWMIALVTEIGTTLYREIKAAKKATRDQYAKEVDANLFKEWDKVAS